MNILFSSRSLFVLGFLLIAAINITVFIGIDSNRTGNPDTLITLAERELRLPYRTNEENTGLSLRLVWRALGRGEDSIYGYSGRRSPGWFSAEKLGELGFNIEEYGGSRNNRAYYKTPLPKEVFIVLENNGESYLEAVRRSEKVFERESELLKLNSEDKKLRDNYERAEKQLKRERTENSRLFAIDAGLDPSELRQKYDNRGKYIIVKGLVKPSYQRNKKKNEVYGIIFRISTKKIHVPLKHRKVLDDVLAQDKNKHQEFQPSRYEIELAYGSRLEPWVMSVKYLADKSEDLNHNLKWPEDDN
jgi:hypothetical protein